MPDILDAKTDAELDQQRAETTSTEAAAGNPAAIAGQRIAAGEIVTIWNSAGSRSVPSAVL